MISVGPTEDLCLRISIATLVRVIFNHPENGRRMLALEQKATLQSGEGERKVLIRAQPFGGAVRIINPDHLIHLIGEFRFDSERSRDEQDFRLYIQPSEWERVRDFCMSNFKSGTKADLETDPVRELAEEFEETMGLRLGPEQYDIKPIGIVVNDLPVRTRNIYASGAPTARMYNVFEALVTDITLIRAMIENSKTHTGFRMRKLAYTDAQKGGRGHSNAVLVAPLEQVREVCLAHKPDPQTGDCYLENTRLDANVATIFL